MANADHSAVAALLQGKSPIGSRVTVRGWVRTRRDSKAGFSVMDVNEGKAGLRIPTRPHPPSNGDAASDGRLPLQERGDSRVVGVGHGVTCILDPDPTREKAME